MENAKCSMPIAWAAGNSQKIKSDKLSELLRKPKIKAKAVAHVIVHGCDRQKDEAVRSEITQLCGHQQGDIWWEICSGWTKPGVWR